MTEAPEPKDKLDATTTTVGVVNGPDDDVLGWRQVDWRAAEANIRRLRQRIFTASQAGDLARVRSLQKLMLRSRANTLVSVRRVTERNAGRLTAGVDSEVVLTPEAKMRLADRIQHQAEPFKALPVRRVYIPKKGSSTKRRPLGIPVVADRVHQARALNALEPEWEARSEPKSYGFRPGRGCHDAIQAIYQVVKGPSPRRLWILDADLAGAFDKIAHDHILAMLGSFPAREMVGQWLRAGVVENGRLSRTEEGTPQGGIVSPALLNIALHGMEQAAGVRYARDDHKAALFAPGSPAVIRYADDLLALCHSRQEALEVKARLANWLASKGLAFNEDKTRVVTLDEGFDFLGFNVRRYRGRKLLIKPSKAAVRRIRERLRTELRSLRGTNAPTVIKKLNPIIRGWAAYYRTQVSSQVFGALDHYLWQLTYKWARFSHANKPTDWVVRRYTTGSTRTGVTDGCSATATAAPTCTSSRGPTSSDTRWSKARRPRTTPSWPSTGPNGGARRPCRSTRPAGGSSQPRTINARSVGTRCCPTVTGRKPHASGSDGWRPPARRSPRPSTGKTTRRTNTNPVSYTPIAASAIARHFCPPAPLRGLLEPDARKRARPGSEGAGLSNASGLPDQGSHETQTAPSAEGSHSDDPGAPDCIGGACSSRNRLATTLSVGSRASLRGSASARQPSRTCCEPSAAQAGRSDSQ
jgi:RNA-directed DNA polymerase